MQVGGLSQKDIMSEWKRAFLISRTSRAQPMEQREQKPNLFGFCRVVTEEDEVKLFSAMPWRENVCWKHR